MNPFVKGVKASDENYQHGVGAFMKQNKGGRKRLRCFPFLYLKELEAEQRKETSGAQQSEEEVASN